MAKPFLWEGTFYFLQGNIPFLGFALILFSTKTLRSPPEGCGKEGKVKLQAGFWPQKEPRG